MYSILSGFTLDGCRDGVGGVPNIYLTEFDNIDTFTENSNVVTATLKATKKWRKVECEKDTANFVETHTGSRQNASIFYTQTVTIKLNGLKTETRTLVRLLAKNKLAIICEIDGKYWLIGRRDGAMLTTGTTNSGTTMADGHNYQMTFEAMEKEMAIEVNSTFLSDVA